MQLKQYLKKCILCEKSKRKLVLDLLVCNYSAVTYFSDTFKTCKTKKTYTMPSCVFGLLYQIFQQIKLIQTVDFGLKYKYQNIRYI